MNTPSLFGVKFVVILVAICVGIAIFAPQINKGITDAATNAVTQSGIANGSVNTLTHPTMENAKDLSKAIYGDNDPLSGYGH